MAPRSYLIFVLLYKQGRKDQALTLIERTLGPGGLVFEATFLLIS